MEKSLYIQQKQDQELTVAQIISSLLQNFRLKLKKVGKTTRPFWYDCNQIPMIIQWVIQIGFKSNDRFSQMSETEGYLTDR